MSLGVESRLQGTSNRIGVRTGASAFTSQDIFSSRKVGHHLREGPQALSSLGHEIDVARG